MIRPRPILHVLIVFLATNIPEGASVAGSVCTGETGSGCWQEITNLPGCHVWNANPQEEETVTWSGDCLDGKSSGTGKLTWHVKNSAGDNVTFTTEGPMVDGKRHGNWVLRTADGGVSEGPYVDGKMHGNWVLRFADGDVAEGPYVDYKRHGHWVLRFADGDVAEGPYVDGKRHGNWVLRTADGGVHEGPFVDDEQHGNWVLRTADGDVSEGPFVDGERRVGPWNVQNWAHWVRRIVSDAVGRASPDCTDFLRTLPTEGASAVGSP